MNSKIKDQKTTALEVKKERHEYVMTKIESLQKKHGISFPTNYNYANAIQSAWLILQDVKDKAGNYALAVCEPNSIANFMLDMVSQGLSLVKKQGYPIVYGNQLTFQRSYFGTLAILKRQKNVKSFVVEVVRQGEKFEIGMIDGVKYIKNHEVSFETLDNEIIGAYCIIKLNNGDQYTEIMTKKMIDKSWSKTKMASNNVQKEFPDQMAKRTVINRAAKYFLNSSDDSELMPLSSSNDEDDLPDQKEASEIVINEKANSEVLKIEVCEEAEIIDKETGEVSEDPGF